MNKSIRFVTVIAITIASLVSFGAVADAGKHEKKAALLSLYVKLHVVDKSRRRVLQFAESCPPKGE
jgi:hypothetical protein